MSSFKTWTVVAGKRAQKVIARAPRHDQERLRTALKEMGSDPFTGDIERLKDERAAFRRRVGDWRVFFDVDPERRVVNVSSVERRTTTTYRRR
jgi:mRNA-degrading endonuclease RelE of RelBE toxin-antitoxin system